MAVDNYNFWKGKLDWNPGEFIRWIVIVQRDKDMELRTEAEFWEISEYKKNCSLPNNTWTKFICNIPITSESDFINSKSLVVRICNVLGARAYFLPNKVYASITAEQCLGFGINSDFSHFPTVNPSTQLYSIYGKVYLTGTGGYKWFEKDWWYELDCDTINTGGHVEDWIAEKNKAIEVLKSLVTVTELYEVPSKTGIHVLFRIQNSEFPSEKYKDIMKEECIFHSSAIPNLYIPNKRYYLTTKPPAV